MLTAEKLRSQTSKDLAQLAKKKGVQGWHSMRKEQLVKALLKLARQNSRKKSETNGLANGKSRSTKRLESKAANVKSNGRGQPTNPKLAARIRRERNKLESLKSLDDGRTETTDKDRIILIVRDSYWVQAYWEITQNSIRRAKVALGPHWHNAKPVLRVSESAVADSSNTIDQIAREIEIHGGVNNWYIPIENPPKAIRVTIGYLGQNGRFHAIAKSNEVSTPLPSSNESFDLNWADIEMNHEKIFVQSCSANGHEESSDLRDVFEEKLRRPMTTSLFAQFSGPDAHLRNDLDFSVDAEMIVFGKASPGASVTIAGEPVRIDTDGSFAIRMAMPDRRQVLPVVATSRDGSQQRTTVLAVERNTKVMEPLSIEHEEV